MPKSTGGGRGAARPHRAEFIAGAADRAVFPRLSYPEIAFAGRSNVGKSTLLNRLVGHRGLARVSKTPGRTQQLNFFAVDERLVFVDLPGYGFARVPLAVRAQWKALVEGYLSRRATLRAVIVVVDLRRGLEPEDIVLLEYLRAHRIAAVVAATKADKLGRGERRRLAEILAHALAGHAATLVVCSGDSGDGVPELWRTIEVCAQ